VFADVTTSDFFGSVSTSTASNGTTLSITLDADALAAIITDQGGNIFFGGVDSGELSTTTAFDFGNAGSSDHSTLSLVTRAAVPECSSILLLSTLLGACGIAMRKRRV
jgi:hypothetical protein